jgi:hypothetical protein
MWQTAQQRTSAAALVRAMFHPVAFGLDELSMLYGPPSRPHSGDSNEEPDILSADRWQEVNHQACLVIEHYKTFKSRIHRFEAGLNLLSANSLRVALALESEIEDAVRDAVRPLAPGERRLHSNFSPGSPPWNNRFAVTTFNRHIQDYMAELGQDAA